MIQPQGFPVRPAADQVEPATAPAPRKIADVIGAIREAGCSARYDSQTREYRVALPRGVVADPEASAYYTTDAEDAVATAARMVAEHNASVDRAKAAARPLYLVACVAEKAAEPCAARDLYRSDWFRKARAYVEASGGEWRILSAEHGLVDPGQVLAPYDRTLTKMGKAARRAWAERVVEQLRTAEGLAGRPVVILAGERYRDPFLVWYLGLAGGSVTVPMEGLGLGEQKAWLARAAAEAVEATREKIARALETTIDDAEAELARGPVPGRFNLVTEDLMAVVRAPGGGYRLGKLTGDRVLTAEGYRHASTVARRWNDALTPDQVAARCAVRVLSRAEALEALRDQSRRLLMDLTRAG